MQIRRNEVASGHRSATAPHWMNDENIVMPFWSFFWDIGHRSLDIIHRNALNNEIIDDLRFSYVSSPNIPRSRRCLVQPERADKVLLPLPESTVIGTVTSVSEGADSGEVALADGRKVPFDYALVCVGSSYAGLKGVFSGTSIEERKA